jgi:hypothetical protein
MKRSHLILCFCLGLYALSNGQSALWTPINESSINKNLFINRDKPAKYKLYKLQEQSLIDASKLAPSEKQSSVILSGTVISFPDASGALQRFRIVESPVMDPTLSAKYPDIKSYSGKGIDNSRLNIRFSVSASGLFATITSTDHNTQYIDVLDKKDKYYMVVDKKSLGKNSFQCLTTDPGLQSLEIRAAVNADDGKLRTYRLALCTTGEFSAHWLDGTETTDAQRKAKVLAALNNTVTATNAIYERDFGVRMVLVPNNDAVIYLNASSDPFTTSGSWNSQTQSTCDGVIGSANYDIGHMVTKAGNNGNAGCIGCVCTNSSKGRGWTAYSDPSSVYFVVDYLTHEMGHQFGGNHTFSFSDENTIAQVEPGSGSTIMGYAGITGSTDVQAHSDAYFHAVTIQQVTTYIQSGGGSGCDVETITGNIIPIANAGADFTIPRSTPFELTGTGTDGDAGDVLSYCWEQMNVIGSAQSFPSATATAGPVFRSFSPSGSTKRTFPAISSILSGTNVNTWEVLPSVARTLNFRFTVQDNRAGGGGNQSDDMAVVISGTTGPFSVTSPNTIVTWGAGTNQTVTWSVNGTNGSPINCTEVSISISTDGGLNFTTLIANTANDGSETITVPNTTGTTNRIKVAAVGNIFFDISNTNFTIGTPPVCGDPAGLTTTGISASGATVNWNSVASALSYDVQYKPASSSTWSSSINTTSLSTVLSGLNASTQYDWRVRANCSGGSGNFVASQFTTSAIGGSCPGTYDSEPNGTTAQSATIPLNTDIKGTLGASGDNDYYRISISTGGTLVISLTTLPANYQLQFLNSSGGVIASSTNSGNTSESISRTVTTGTYFARVYPRNNGAWNATSCYTLRAGNGTASIIAKSGSNRNTEAFSIYPNPVSHTLNLDLGVSAPTGTVHIYNMLGKISLVRNITHSNTQINISQLPAGNYILQYSDGSVHRTSKFIKQ